VTLYPRTSKPWFNVEGLVSDVGDFADVVILETTEATWALSQLLPKRLDVYGGAVRIWWPGLASRSRRCPASYR
jgi:hypothetical protein